MTQVNVFRARACDVEIGDVVGYTYLDGRTSWKVVTSVSSLEHGRVWLTFEGHPGRSYSIYEPVDVQQQVLV